MYKLSQVVPWRDWRSLSVVCLAISLVVALLASTIITAYQVQQARQMKVIMMNSYEDFADTILILVDGLSYKTASVVAGSFNKQENVVAILVKDVYGTAIYDSFKDVNISDYSDDAAVLHRFHSSNNYQEKNKNIAVKLLYSDVKIAKLVFDNAARLIVVFFIVASVSINFALFYYIRRYVILPIDDLHATINRSLELNKPVSHSLPEHTSLGNLAQAYNEMMNEILRRRNEEVRTEKLKFIGTIAASVAHEFNNLLAIVLSSSEAIKLSSVNYDKRIDTIYDAALDGSYVVAKLLKNSHYSNIEEKTIFTIEDIFKKVIEGSQAFIVGKNIVLNSSIDHHGVMEENKSELFCSVLNIVKNAIEALGSTGGKINISFRLAVAEELMSSAIPVGRHSTGVITIEDNGPGVDGDYIKQIFDPFLSTKEVGKGVGLGLWSASEYLKAIGGKLCYERAKPHGAIFSLYVPLSKASMPAMSGQCAGSGDLDLSDIRILIVEDQVSICDVYCSYLSSLGAVVQYANEFLSAKQYLAKNEIDVLFTDLHLPDGSGLELAEMVFSVSRRPYVIVSSGNLDEITLSNSYYDLLLPKPVRLSRIAIEIANGAAEKKVMSNATYIPDTVSLPLRRSTIR